VLKELGSLLEHSNVSVNRIRLPYSLAPTLESLQLSPGDVCVLDVCLPLAAVESLITALRERFPDVRILVVAEEVSDLSLSRYSAWG
jgi:hypothetical protein